MICSDCDGWGYDLSDATCDNCGGDGAVDDPEPQSVYSMNDCCIEIIFSAEPVLVIGEGDVDPFTGVEGNDYSPITYWSNGNITQGHYEEIEADA